MKKKTLNPNCCPLRQSSKRPFQISSWLVCEHRWTNSNIQITTASIELTEGNRCRVFTRTHYASNSKQLQAIKEGLDNNTWLRETKNYKQSL